ncbi:MAG: rubredoxin [Deltaproteobacteria bacterium]|nr:rubredoxin [Deltaproteobacteria bacterium]
MATWKCKKCGHTKDSRCKPKKCPECEGKDAFEKQD